MKVRMNIISVCLAAMFAIIFGSILSMALFTEREDLATVRVEAATQTPNR